MLTAKLPKIPAVCQNGQLEEAITLYDDTYSWFVEKRRYHKSEHDNRERVKQDEEENEQEVGVLEHLKGEQQDAADDRQEENENSVNDEPREPKDRILESHDLHSFLDLVLLLPHYQNEQVRDELRQSHHHVERDDDAKRHHPVAGVGSFRKHL